MSKWERPSRPTPRSHRTEFADGGSPTPRPRLLNRPGSLISQFLCLFYLDSRNGRSADRGSAPRGAGADPARGGGGGCRPVGVLRGSSTLGRPASSGAPRSWPGTGDRDRDRCGFGASAEDPGPWRERGGPDPVRLGDPAAFRAADALAGRGAASAVSVGGFERGLQGGALGAPGSEFFEPDAGSDRAFEGGLGVGTRALAAPGPFGTPVCLCLGGRDLPTGPSGGRKAVRSGADRGDSGGPEGTSGLPDGVPGERPELAGAALGSQGAEAHDPAGVGHRRRGSGLLEGAGRDLPQDPSAALLGSQDGERAEQNAEVAARECQAGPARDLDGGKSGRGGAGHGAFTVKYEVTYSAAVTRLEKDREALLAFHDFPAEHWRHIRTTNPIESVFAAVWHRSVRSKGGRSHRTALAIVFKLVMAARKTWRRLNGYDKLPRVIEGVQFTDAIQADETDTRAAA